MLKEKIENLNITDEGKTELLKYLYEVENNSLFEIEIKATEQELKSTYKESKLQNYLKARNKTKDDLKKDKNIIAVYQDKILYISY